MAENTTISPWSIPYPSGTGKVKLGATDMQEIAERVTAIFKERLTTISSHGTSFTAASGELVKATAAITVTLPAVAANATVGVLANGNAVTVGAGSAKIYGDFVEGVTPIKLVGYQHVVLISDGTNWYIVAGEPARENKYSKKVYSVPEAEAGVTPSTTRPAIVTITPRSGALGESIYAIITVGGQEAGYVEAKSAGTNITSLPVTVWTNPGEAWKLAGHEHVESINVYTKIL